MSGNEGDRATLLRLRALIGARRFPEADALAHELLAKDSHDSECLFLLGVVQAEQKQFDSALVNLRRSIDADPNPHWTKRLALTNVLRDAGDPVAAETAARRLLDDVPDNAPALNSLGLALLDQHRETEASLLFQRAITVAPDYAPAYLNAARALERRGDFDGAKMWYLRAASADPRVAADAYRRIARLCYAEADIFAAIGSYEQAVKLRDDNADVWNLLGNAYMDVAAITNATRCYQSALSINPDYAEVFDNLLLCHHYDPTIDADRMFDAHREWARRFAPGGHARGEPVRRRSRPSGLLRVGFVSQSLCRGPTGFFLLPLLRNLDARRFAAYCYHAGFQRDDVTDELRRYASSWSDVGAESDDALARRIADDGVAIVVDLAGHAPGNRLRAIARKPAPIVVSWLDYFDTTGVDCVDFLIGDSVSIPPEARQRFTETVIRIEPSRLCYAPPAYAPSPASPPMLRNGYPTFGSFNRLAKIAEPVVDLWAALMKSVPRSRLLLKSAAFNHPNTRKIFATRFEQRGIDVGRLELRGSSPHSQMLAEYADVDIALDPFPYNGGLTTCEAIWMGVPVVALMGDSMISRQSAALLMAAGLSHWVAQTPEQWIEIASRWSTQPHELAEARRRLRGVVASSPLVDGAHFASRFEGLLDQMCAWEHTASGDAIQLK